MTEHHDPTTFGQLPDEPQLTATFLELCQTIAKLRSPEGCPWDREQTLASIKPYTLEETYELLEAIDADNNEWIAEELGDVLLQVLLDAQIGKDEGRFDLIQVMAQLNDKMIRRHPHVFGEEKAESAADVSQHWNRAKNAEKQRDSVLDGIPIDLPQLARAYRLSSKAARVGFDFPQRAMLFDKLREEVAELADELFADGKIPEVPASVDGDIVPDEPIADNAQRERVESELGDMLFVVANIARRWKINPEEALRKSNTKFLERFQYIEQQLTAQGKTIETATLQEMEDLYQQGKSESETADG